MSDLFGNPKERLCRDAGHFIHVLIPAIINMVGSKNIERKLRRFPDFMPNHERLSVTMENRIASPICAKNLMQPFPYYNDVSDKGQLNL